MTRDHNTVTEHERMFLRETALRDDERRAAARYVTSRATDGEDASTLLDMLGLQDVAA